MAKLPFLLCQIVILLVIETLTFFLPRDLLVSTCNLWQKGTWKCISLGTRRQLMPFSQWLTLEMQKGTCASAPTRFQGALAFAKYAIVSFKNHLTPLGEGLSSVLQQKASGRGIFSWQTPPPCVCNMADSAEAWTPGISAEQGAHRILFPERCSLSTQASGFPKPEADAPFPISKDLTGGHP